MRLDPRITRAASLLAVCGALSFGAAQAMAAPAQVEERPQVCDPRVCDRVCRAIGAFGGFCNGAGGCSCYIGAP